MKKATIFERIVCILFCCFIGVIGLMYLLLPKNDFSELEKRNLSAFPEMTMENLVSGTFGSELEDYLADHMPGRDFFVGVGAYYDLLTGRQSSKDIYLAENNRLVETPVVYDREQAEKNMKYINRFAATVGQDVDLILVPSAGFILEDTIQGIHDDYRDDEIIETIYDLAGDGLRSMDLTSLFQNFADGDALYYRTDHHWTSYGAYTAYKAYMQCLGRDYPEESFFTVKEYTGFRGSTYSRSALWLTPGETIQLWHGSAVQVETADGLHDGPFYTQRLEEADMYTVFLNGNQPIVRLYNENNAGKGKILVIRDSYANCLGPFLAESYEEVVMVDLRYYKLPISTLVAEEGFDNILVMYSIGNFMTDENLPYLK